MSTDPRCRYCDHNYSSHVGKCTSAGCGCSQFSSPDSEGKFFAEPTELRQLRRQFEETKTYLSEFKALVKEELAARERQLAEAKEREAKLVEALRETLIPLKALDLADGRNWSPTVRSQFAKAEPLALAALAASVKYTPEKMIKVWPFDAAPEELKKHSRHGGDEDWLALVPPALRLKDIPWLEYGGFGPCHIQRDDLPDGSVVFIGAHA